MTGSVDEWTQDIHQGDALELLDDIPAKSVHAVVTDPPYGLAFMGRDWDDFEPKEYQEWCEVWASKAKRVLKPGGHLLAFSGNRTHHRLFTGVEDAGFEIRDTLTWHYGSGFPKASDVSKVIDKRAGADREVVGVKPGHEDFAGRDTDGHLGGEGTHEGYKRDWMEKDDAGDYHKQTAPATQDAKRWDGWKTGLKPATEFVVMARKPFDGATVDCVLEYGTGALNIDRCRVAGSDGDGNWTSSSDEHDGEVFKEGSSGLSGGVESESPAGGRYPANVVFGERAAADLDARVGELSSGELKGEYSSGNPDNDIYSDGFDESSRRYESNSGGPSRYFYTSKATRAERTMDGTLDNDHPTVKPADLMEWLVKLVTREGQIVLDPFAGSGTTCLAAKGLGRRFVGIELQPEYVSLAQARAGVTVDQPDLLLEDGETPLTAYADGGTD